MDRNNQHLAARANYINYFYFILSAFSFQLLFLESNNLYAWVVFSIVGFINLFTEKYNLDAQLDPFYRNWNYRLRAFCIYWFAIRINYDFIIYPTIKKRYGSKPLSRI